MPESDLPCLDLLEATPETLRGLMREISDDDARWKPAPDRFSIAEVLAHLSHSESHCYRMRVDRFLAEERPFFQLTMRKCISISIEMPTPQSRSIISKNSARTISNFWRTCRLARGA